MKFQEENSQLPQFKLVCSCILAEAHQRPIKSVEFIPELNYIISAGCDPHIALWKIAVTKKKKKTGDNKIMINKDK